MVVGSSVVLWAFALFAITALNSLRAEVKDLRHNMESVLSATDAQSLAAMQMVDKDGQVTYTFKRLPASAPGACGMAGGACGMGGGACALGGVGAGGCSSGEAKSCPAPGNSAATEAK